MVLIEEYEEQDEYAPKQPPPIGHNIDCSMFYINHNILLIGLDPKNSFNAMVIIVAPFNHVVMPHTCLTQIYSMFDDILSAVCDSQGCTCVLSFTPLFDTETTKLSCKKFREESLLVIESKNDAFCNVSLTHADLLLLDELRECVFTKIDYKLMTSRPMVVQLFEKLCENVEKEFNSIDELPKSPDEMIIFLKNWNNEQENTSSEEVLLKNIKLFACEQILDRLKSTFSNNTRDSELEVRWLIFL